MTEITANVEMLASAQDIAAISAMLNEHNSDQGMVYNPQPLSVFIRGETGTVLAGLTGSTHWEWLRIKLLAVSKTVRDKGYGTKLLQAAEQEALRRGCKYAFVDTFSFQALPFYTKNGFEVFAELTDYPAGNTRIFLRKQLKK